jgi:hypothetical protein
VPWKEECYQCKGTSVCLLTSPILSHSPPVHMFSPPHLCTSSKDHTPSRQLLGPTVQRLSRSRLTDSRWLPASHSARTWAASDEPQMHWDRSAWCYGTLCHHVDNHIWEAY